MARPAIVFIGFMGAGKSTALAAARGAGIETTEIDNLMEAELGMPIKAAFETFGEEGFREREAEVVGGLLERADGGAIALGGGSVLSPRIRNALGRHVVVWLQVGPAEAWRRIAHSDRPLATSAADVARLLATRLPLYEELADAIVPPGDRAIVERALPSIQALAELPAGTGAKLVWASTPSDPTRDYPIVIGEGILRSYRPSRGGRRFTICDENTERECADRVEPIGEVVSIQAGEESKTLATVGGVLERLAAAGMTREDHVVALGGGVVGDLAGFCAHCYQRGVPVIQMPTTLVSQVDSAIGGKTGVDLPQGKNYAGAYHQPAAVISDLETLRSLPPEELAAGYVEVLKTGLLAGGELWERSRDLESLDPKDPGALAELRNLVFHCSRYKAMVVAADERDAGLRNALNLGHTVGHAIEVATSYRRYRHGEAVGLGLLAALRLSGAQALRDEVETALARHDLPTSTDGIDVDEILSALQRDKKRTAAGVGFVLLADPGRPRTGQLVADDEVRAAVEELYA
jgi:shikimate kinase/3-dehydroquinate synthase